LKVPEQLVAVKSSSNISKLNEVASELPLNRALGLLFQHAMIILSLALKATGFGWALVVAARLIGLADLCVAVRRSFCLVEAPGSIAGAILSAQACGSQPGDGMQILAFMSDLLIALSDIMDVVLLLGALGLFSMSGGLALLPIVGYAALTLGGALLCAKSLMQIQPNVQPRIEGLAGRFEKQKSEQAKGTALLSGLLSIAAACTLASVVFSPIAFIMSGIALAVLLAICTMRLIAHFRQKEPQVVEVGDNARWQKNEASLASAVVELSQDVNQVRSVKGVCAGVTLAGQLMNISGAEVAGQDLCESSEALSSAITEVKTPQALIKVCVNPAKHDNWINLVKATAQECKTLSRYRVVELTKGTLKFLGWVSCTAELYLAGCELWNSVVSKPAARAPEESVTLFNRIKGWKLTAASSRIALAAAAVVALFFGHLALAIIASAGVLIMTISRVTANLMERSSEWRLKPLDIDGQEPAPL